MRTIHILDPEVSNKIAAGEVVERPLSIVKELVENSIDAGATVITVEIKEGGISYIRVADNGSGMTEDDAKICFLRHATSKIATGEDLDAIYTLGFRGEALSSIGAVAKVKLYTKKHDTDMGVLVTCEGGEILSSAESGMTDGTVLEVTDLFYNTPARKKFLKKPSAEGGYISDLLGRYVFAHPEISFKLIRDGKEVLFSAGDNNIINSVYSVYGKDYAKNMLNVDYEYNGIRITGLIGKGTLCRANRNYETFLVNKRYIKSAIMIRALEEAYKNQIMISKFPTSILNIEIPAELVDINVHPTKLECKFSNEQDIYQAVYHAVRNTLYAIPNVPQIEQLRSNDTSVERPVVEQKSLEDMFREKLRESEKLKQEQNAKSDIVPVKEVTEPVTKIKPITEPVRETELIVEHEAEIESEKTETPQPTREEQPPTPTAKSINDYKRQQDEFAMFDYAEEYLKNYSKGLKVKSPVFDKKGNHIVEPGSKNEDWLTYLVRRRLEAKSEAEKNPFHDGFFRVIGQVFDTYILVEKDSNMMIIDQHAAHERLNFEGLKAALKENGIASQMILEPIEVDLQPNECEVYQNNEAAFEQLGFQCRLSDNTVIISALPGDIGWSNGKSLFYELLSQMEEMKNSIISEKKERLLYTISCKASIKANMKVSMLEMEELVRKVFALENINTCPHGRPIVISMSKKQLEKDFRRIT